MEVKKKMEKILNLILNYKKKTFEFYFECNAVLLSRAILQFENYEYIFVIWLLGRQQIQMLIPAEVTLSQIYIFV